MGNKEALEGGRGSYFSGFCFLRCAATGGRIVFVHDVISCLALVAASRFTMTIA